MMKYALLFIALFALAFGTGTFTAEPAVAEDYSVCDSYDDECGSRCRRLDDKYDKVQSACSWCWACNFLWSQSLRCSWAVQDYEQTSQWFLENCVNSPF